MEKEKDIKIGFCAAKLYFFATQRAKKSAFLCFTIAQSTFAAAAGADESKLVPLFNGRDQSGLYTWLVDTKHNDPRGVFSVTNGLLRISGDGLGYISTRQSYANYRLIVEFKWGNRNWTWGDRVGKARDAGIFLHTMGPDGNSHDGRGAFKAGIECNLFQGSTGDFILIRGDAGDGSVIAPRITVDTAAERDADGWPFWSKRGGRVTLQRWGRVNWFDKDRHWQDQLDFRGARDVEKPAGEWNRIECRCDADHIEIWLNGVLVNEAFDVYPAKGPILLQCEGSEIFVRKFELRPLGAKRAP